MIARLDAIDEEGTKQLLGELHHPNHPLAFSAFISIPSGDILEMTVTTCRSSTHTVRTQGTTVLRARGVSGFR
jgi:hypothetical protein